MRHYNYIIAIIISLFFSFPGSAQKRQTGDLTTKCARTFVNMQNTKVGKLNNVLKLTLTSVEAAADHITVVYTKDNAEFTYLYPELTEGKFKTEAQENRFIDREYDLWIVAKAALSSTAIKTLIGKADYSWNVSVVGPDKSELYTYTFTGSMVSEAIAICGGKLPADFKDFISKALDERALHSIFVQVYLPHDSIGMCSAQMNGHNVTATMLTTHAGYAKMKENNGEAVRKAWLATFFSVAKDKSYYKDLITITKVRKPSVHITLRDVTNAKDSMVYTIFSAEILAYIANPVVADVSAYLVDKLGGAKQIAANRGKFVEKYGPDARKKVGNLPAEKSKKVYEVVEEMPQFPGGSRAIVDYIANNVRYPYEAQEKGVQGRVRCKFTVTSEGEVADVEVVRSVDPLLDKEAVRLISTMPRWIPAKHNGTRVSSKYILAVTFRLNK